MEERLRRETGDNAIATAMATMVTVDYVACNIGNMIDGTDVLNSARTRLLVNLKYIMDLHPERASELYESIMKLPEPEKKYLVNNFHIPGYENNQPALPDSYRDKMRDLVFKVSVFFRKGASRHN